MDCLRDLQETFNKMDNNNTKAGALLAVAKHGNIKVAEGNAKLAGFIQKPEVQKSEKFEGTPVNVLSMNDLADVINHADKKFGEREQAANVNQIGPKINSLKDNNYSQPNRVQEDR